MNVHTLLLVGNYLSILMNFELALATSPPCIYSITRYKSEQSPELFPVISPPVRCWLQLYVSVAALITPAVLGLCTDYMHVYEVYMYVWIVRGVMSLQ